jgi:hypothetical protein
MLGLFPNHRITNSCTLHSLHDLKSNSGNASGTNLSRSLTASTGRSAMIECVRICPLWSDMRGGERWSVSDDTIVSGNIRGAQKNHSQTPIDAGRPD